MSTSEDQDKLLIMCRLCMDKNVLLVNLNPKNGNVHSPGDILEVIEAFTTVKIDPLDDLPQTICESCIQMLNSMLAFRNKCKRTDRELHKMIASRDRSLDVIEIFDDCDTKENSDVNADDSDYSLEPPDAHCTFDPETMFTVHNSRNDMGPIDNTDESEGRRYRPERVACHICGKLYEVYKMKYHMNMHNGLKPFECDEGDCTSKFAAPHQLNKHKKLCHILKPLLCCDVCGRGFKVKVGLEMHRSYHFDPKLPCHICEKLFRNTRALNKHMLVHSQERKFKCEICAKSFQTRYTLRIHKRVHTQEKPYSCHCGVSFAYKCLLKAHNEKYHK